MTQKKSKQIIEKLERYYGKVSTGLYYKNLYQLTIAVVLSAQTNDKQVNAVSPLLFKLFPNFQSLSKANIKEVENIIKSIGLYRNKAKNIIKLSKEIINKQNGNLPNNYEELIELPGIGRKSANVILSQGFNKPAFAVDTHVKRIANRLGYIKSNDTLKIEKALTYYIPIEDWVTSHLLFINHGRRLCKARHPLCYECPIRDLCDEVGNIS